MCGPYNHIDQIGNGNWSQAKLWDSRETWVLLDDGGVDGRCVKEVDLANVATKTLQVSGPLMNNGSQRVDLAWIFGAPGLVVVVVALLERCFILIALSLAIPPCLLDISLGASGGREFEVFVGEPRVGFGRIPKGQMGAARSPNNVLTRPKEEIWDECRRRWSGRLQAPTRGLEASGRAQVEAARSSKTCRKRR